MTKVKCPTCGKQVKWEADNPYKPFCCERCKLIDLGAWADENNRIPGTETVIIENEYEH
jgi:endogenous inhibitor of DNA gyrase (YacG/DUF329 family)